MGERKRFRVERDSLGEVEVPEEALYGAQTQRAVDNFPLSGQRMPARLIHVLGAIKAAAAQANAMLGQLDAGRAQVIIGAALETSQGLHDAHFPVDVYQSGSGTSTNMNANEVIASLAARRSGASVHPNDHVNRGQSSNDVIATAIHVASRLECGEELLPALDRLESILEQRATEYDDVVKTGRTHLMDALPITLGQEIRAWSAQVHAASERIHAVMPRLERIAQGATAVGTGANAHPRFAQLFAAELSVLTGIAFTPADNLFAAVSCQDSAVELSGQLRGLAIVLSKIADDLRWMNSGPLHGLAEIRLRALQPGSSMMPGKVNPVIPEAVAMVCAQVIGNDCSIGLAGQASRFQLNTMMPLIAADLLESIRLLGRAARLLADRALADFEVDRDRLRAQATDNPVLVTALAETLGYDMAARIAARAFDERRPLRELVLEMTELSGSEVDRLLDPAALARGATHSA
jgi:fumarate hydratase class II